MVFQELGDYSLLGLIQEAVRGQSRVDDVEIFVMSIGGEKNGIASERILSVLRPLPARERLVDSPVAEF